MHQVIGHDIAPADFIMEHGYFGKFSFLAAFLFIVIIFSFMPAYPFPEYIKFIRVGEYDFEMSFLFNRFQVIIEVMMVFMAVAYNFCGKHKQASIMLNRNKKVETTFERTQ